MPKFICDICGGEYEQYDNKPYELPLTDSVGITVHDIKNKSFTYKLYSTCRPCACAVRGYIDKLIRSFREEK